MPLVSSRTPPETIRRTTAYMRLDELLFADRNPKLHDLPGIIAALQRYGCIGAMCVLDERTSKLVGGHGRATALVQMKADGDPLPDGIVIDEDGEWMIPVERGWSSRNDLEAEAAIIALNQLTIAGGWHMLDLTTMIEDIVTGDATLMETTALTWDEIDNMIARVDPETYLTPTSEDREPTIAPPETAQVDTDDYGPHEANLYDRARTHTCPSCGFDFED